MLCFLILIKKILLLIQVDLCFNIVCMSGEQVTNSGFYETHTKVKKTSRNSKKVDITILLNNVKEEKKKEKFENTIFYGLAATAIVVTGIIVSL